MNEGSTTSLDKMNVQEIRERWSKATPGPWRYENRENDDGMTDCHCITNGVMDYTFGYDMEEYDATAIASAPTDIAWLLAEVERLRCCGTCGNWEQFDEFGSEKIHNCIANKKLTWRERFDKCDKWEGVE